MDTGNRPAEILLVEDNPGDVRLTQEALRGGKVINRLHVVGDGLAAMAFLRREGEHAAAPVPDLILLDLNLPGMDGREVLDQIKQDDALKTIPVAVLTSSAAEEDIARSYGSHANCYIQKPVDFQRLAEVVAALSDFWFALVKLPHRDTAN